jgi:hypothetical protein
VNPQFRFWFSQGKVAEALGGLGTYFVGGVTYSDTHDFILAVGELLDWAKQEHQEEPAARGFEAALQCLLQTGALRSGLLLMRAYQLMAEDEGLELPLDHELVIALIARAVQSAAQELSQDEELRDLTCLVVDRIPLLKNKLGLK